MDFERGQETRKIRTLEQVLAAHAFTEKVKDFCFNSTEEAHNAIFGRNPNGWSFLKVLDNYHSLLAASSATQQGEIERRQKIHAIELLISEFQEGEQQCEGIFLNGLGSFPSDSAVAETIRASKDRIKQIDQIR